MTAGRLEVKLRALITWPEDKLCATTTHFGHSFPQEQFLYPVDRKLAELHSGEGKIYQHDVRDISSSDMSIFLLLPERAIATLT
jgi:hypothetical protein